MTREEAVKDWIIPALNNTWNEKKITEILKALEQPCENAISIQAVLDLAKKNGIYTIMRKAINEYKAERGQ